MLADRQYSNIDEAAARHCTERTPIGLIYGSKG
jgi:hypothetical protein